ncbi:MAG: DUF4214 domain-containing protein [Dyella sp.]|nr:DUF4214 domain-containing protein [Dyella sp.]
MELQSQEVMFLQTAEAIYWPLLEQSSRSVRAYCDRHGFGFHTFFGVLRGHLPWHATYNRITIIRSLADAGYQGWVFYLDSDAYIISLAFDLRVWLGEQRKRALIIAPAAPDAPWWHVNSGVFIINLGSVMGQRIARGWSDRFNAIPDEALLCADEWTADRGDQWLLAQTLQEMPEAERSVFIDRGTPHLINYEDGLFIRHQLRAYGSLRERHDRISRETDRLLGQTGSTTTDQAVDTADVARMQDQLARALYRTVLLREPDPGGLATWLEFIRSGAALEHVLSAYFRSDEFARMYPRFIARHVNAWPHLKQ